MTHPVLEALLEIARFGESDPDNGRASMGRRARGVVPAFEELLAEHERMRTALREIDTMDKEDAPRAAMSRVARAALNGGK